MSGFAKFLVGLLVTIISIALIVCLVAGIMSAVHDQTIIAEFKDWWFDWIRPLFERMHWVKETTANIRF